MPACSFHDVGSDQKSKLQYLQKSFAMCTFMRHNHLSNVPTQPSSTPMLLLLWKSIASCFRLSGSVGNSMASAGQLLTASIPWWMQLKNVAFAIPAEVLMSWKEPPAIYQIRQCRISCGVMWPWPWDLWFSWFFSTSKVGEMLAVCSRKCRTYDTSG